MGPLGKERKGRRLQTTKTSINSARLRKDTFKAITSSSRAMSIGTVISNGPSAFWSSPATSSSLRCCRDKSLSARSARVGATVQPTSNVNLEPSCMAAVGGARLKLTETVPMHAAVSGLGMWVPGEKRMRGPGSRSLQPRSCSRRPSMLERRPERDRPKKGVIRRRLSRLRSKDTRPG